MGDLLGEGEAGLSPGGFAGAEDDVAITRAGQPRREKVGIGAGVTRAVGDDLCRAVRQGGAHGGVGRVVREVKRAWQVTRREVGRGQRFHEEKPGIGLLTGAQRGEIDDGRRRESGRRRILLHTQQNEDCVCCVRNKIIRMTKKTLSEVQLGAWKALLNAHATAVVAIEAKLGAADQIPLTWYDVLWALRKQGEHACLRFRELQDEIVLSRSALSRVIDALAKAGLVKKKPCAEDARGLDVELTEKGHRALASAWPVYAEGIQEHFARHLTVAECEQVAALLSKVTRASQ